MARPAMTAPIASATSRKQLDELVAAACTQRADHLFGGERVMRNPFSSVSFRAFPWFKCFSQAETFAISSITGPCM
jgi:hypothetical protein